MMKKFILTLMFALFSLVAYSQSIAYAQEKHENGKYYYYFYDSDGQKIRKVEVNNAKLVGYSSGLVAFEVDRNYFIYSNNFTLIGQFNKNDVGNIDHVFTDQTTGKNGFVTVRGNKSYMWDEKGKNYKIIE